MTVWLRIPCGCCNGIEWGGDHPRECRQCGGIGMLWVSERDRLADWPGGPLRGSYPGQFGRACERIGVEAEA